MALRPYPAFSPEAFATLIAKVRGGDVSNAAAVHSAYEVIGFGLAQGLPDGPVATFHEDVRRADQLADALQAHLEAHTKRAAGGYGADPVQGLIPWEVLLPLLFQLIQKLLVG